ncbi:OmpA family protein [Geopsychrobacter electrodiphilus]|uniref:OmpA family protein n=1 Tax=Geopsychrobacter electrodiphilus TaxID=225196 RepID=UPI00037EB7C7|nr:OmpA family protein [Geopsychrobacter electrodiphilus]
MKIQKQVLIAFSLLTLILAGCIQPNDPNKNTKQKAGIGAAVGALAGAFIGYQADHSGGALKGALIGGAAGGALGAGAGYYMDKQQAEFEQALSAERAANQIEVERLQNENLKITMNSEVSFDFNSSRLQPAFERSLDKVADILTRYPRTSIKIIGHTDNVGSEVYNQQLSEKRAMAVGHVLEGRGVAASRIITSGRGESEPRATNDTEAGRQLNRRVEMLIVPDSDIK